MSALYELPRVPQDIIFESVAVRWSVSRSVRDESAAIRDRHVTTSCQPRWWRSGPYTRRKETLPRLMDSAALDQEEDSSH